MYHLKNVVWYFPFMPLQLGLGFAIGPILLAKAGTQGFAPFATNCALTIFASIPILAAWKLSPELKKSQHTLFFPYLFHVPSSMMAVLIYGAIQMGALTLITPFSLSIEYNESVVAHFMAILALYNIFLLIPISVISDFAKDRHYSLMGCAILGFVEAFMIPRITKH